MQNLLKNSVKLTNKYLIMATPLILYSLISSIYVASSVNGKLLNLLFALFLYTMMTAAFIAGWFKMAKTGILEPNKEDCNSLIKEFPIGVGEYFLPVLGGLIVLFLLTTFILTGTYFIGNHFIGDIGITAQMLSDAIKTPEALKSFLESLTVEQLIKLNHWNLLTLLSLGFSYFISMFYFPAMFFADKNPFKALWASLKNLFSRKFFISLIIFVAIFVAYFIISILLALFNKMFIFHFIVTLLNFYYLIFITFLIFNYYYENYVKSQLGQNIDTLI